LDKRNIFWKFWIKIQGRRMTENKTTKYTT
jgi:hypothetical protein